MEILGGGEPEKDKGLQLLLGMLTEAAAGRDVGASLVSEVVQVRVRHHRAVCSDQLICTTRLPVWICICE